MKDTKHNTDFHHLSNDLHGSPCVFQSLLAVKQTLEKCQMVNALFLSLCQHSAHSLELLRTTWWLQDNTITPLFFWGGLVFMHFLPQHEHPRKVSYSSNVTTFAWWWRSFWIFFTGTAGWRLRPSWQPQSPIPIPIPIQFFFPSVSCLHSLVKVTVLYTMVLNLHLQKALLAQKEKISSHWVSTCNRALLYASSFVMAKLGVSLMDWAYTGLHILMFLVHRNCFCICALWWYSVVVIDMYLPVFVHAIRRLIAQDLLTQDAHNLACKSTESHWVALIWVFACIMWQHTHWLILHRQTCDLLFCDYRCQRANAKRCLCWHQTPAS